MAAITSLGIGSGIDVNGMVDQLVALERRPLTQLRGQAQSLQTQVSSYGQLTSLASAMQTAASKLTNVGLWQQSKATSSDESAVAVVGGSTAAAGSYSVQVSRLATNQTAVSTASYASANATVGSGTMTIQIGNWDLPPMNFVPKVGRDSVEVALDSSDTLQTLRDKINNASAGVTASIVTDSSGARLALRSSETGAENAFRIQVADGDGNNTDNNGLSRFGFDPASGLTGMEQRVAAQNAQAVVNGIAVSSASNELGSVIEGLTLRLRKEGPASTDIAVSSDRESVKTAIQGFADSYNALAKALAEQTKYDPGSKTGGPLQGDSAATGLQRQLRSLLGAPSSASSTFARLSDIGLQMQRDGTLNVDSAKLDNAVAKLPELRKAFANNDTSGSAADGFARRFSDLAAQVVSTDGTLTTRSAGLRERISRNGDEQAKVEDRVERFRSRLVAQYTAMDANLSRLKSLENYVSQQMKALANNNGSSR